MRLLTIFCVLFLSACSVQVNDMTPEPTVQNFNLSDAEGDGGASCGTQRQRISVGMSTESVQVEIDRCRLQRNVSAKSESDYSLKCNKACNTQRKKLRVIYFITRNIRRGLIFARRNFGRSVIFHMKYYAS